MEPERTPDPWWATLAQGVLAGFAGTTAMTTTYGVERRLRRRYQGPLDYDDSTVPAKAAMKVLGLHRLGDPRQRQLGLLVHWGYGSLMGLPRVWLGRDEEPGTATRRYWAGLMVMAGVLFPVLGDTPPPWRWRPDMIATSLVQHAIYAAVAGAMVDATTR